MGATSRAAFLGRSGRADAWLMADTHRARRVGDPRTGSRTLPRRRPLQMGRYPGRRLLRAICERIRYVAELLRHALAASVSTVLRPGTVSAASRAWISSRPTPRRRPLRAARFHDRARVPPATSAIVSPRMAAPTGARGEARAASSRFLVAALAADRAPAPAVRVTFSAAPPPAQVAASPRPYAVLLHDDRFVTSSHRNRQDFLMLHLISELRPHPARAFAESRGRGFPPRSRRHATALLLRAQGLAWTQRTSTWSPLRSRRRCRRILRGARSRFSISSARRELPRCRDRRPPDPIEGIGGVHGALDTRHTVLDWILRCATTGRVAAIWLAATA